MAGEIDILQWEEDSVNEWLVSIGYGQYQNYIHEHGITGEVLVQLDFDSLKEIGVRSAGHRLELLKAIYRLKIENGVAIEPEHYVPNSETIEDVFSDNTPLGRLMQLINNQNERISYLEQEVQRLQTVVQLEDQFLDKPIRNGPMGGSSLQKQPSLKWATYNGKTVKSPTWTDESSALSLQPQDSPRVSPQSLDYDTPQPGSTSLRPPPPPKGGDPIDLGLNTIRGYSTEASGPPDRGAQPSRLQLNGTNAGDPLKDVRPRMGEDRTDMLQSFKVSLDDPCSKVLPAALKKYRITDDWRMYALFICYGTTERCLSLDEKPLLLFKKLKDAGKNPVFMLRHVRDIRAPITVAQGKQAEKKGRNEPTDQPQNGPMKKIDKVANAPYTRDTRLHQIPAASLQPLTGKGRYDTPDDGDRSRGETNGSGSTGNGAGHTDAVIIWQGVSYAIAIYPYGRDYDDEYDVTVGEMFVVLRRSKGWWEVQRDPTGSGVVDERARRCWVPAGCLLETSMPPATAISEALILASTQPPSPSPQNLASPVGAKPMSDAPILPSSIVSTSYPGVALMDWQPQGDHELNLIKDDLLRVFKRYNHWSYVVKESGRRGWVPSWMIGKASQSANPQTPGSALPSNYDSHPDEHRGLGADISQTNLLASVAGYAPQPSPMSSAFSSMGR
ncbi:Adaptor for signal transduction [Tulasnella sp. 427]|nr:Adaptor for signal transduction [Tulasnella sp. 427]